MRPPYVAAVLLVTAAALAACGGGGGSSPTPVAVAAAGGAIAGAAGASTPGAGLPAGTTAQSAALVAAGSGYGATVTIPATSSGSGTIVLNFALSPPSGVANVQGFNRRPTSIGGALTPIAYITFTPSVTVSFGTTPAFTFTIPAGTATAASYYVGLFDPTSSNGWVTLLGPDTATPTSVTFGAGTRSETFAAGTTYVFALFSTTQALVPASATPFPGGATEVASFTANMPAAARSAAFTFTPAIGSASTMLAAVPSGCSTNPFCTVSVSAPVGTNESVRVLLFASTDGSGIPLAVGTAGTSFTASQPTATSFSLKGVMASFTVSLSPSTLTPGQPAGQVQAVANALDAAAESLAPGYVSTGLQSAPVFSATVADVTGQLTVVAGTQLTYSGAGAGPASVTLNAPSYAPASVSVAYATPVPFTVAFVAGVWCCGQSPNTIDAGEYTAGASGPRRQFDYAGAGGGPPLRFDINGTLWGGPIGVKSDGTSAGKLSFTDTLLAFDTNGNAYATNASSNALNMYAISGTSGTLIRSIAITGRICSAVPDARGNIYIGLCGGGVWAYAAGTTSGSLTPLASDATANPPVAVDVAGDVFTSDAAGGLNVYASGTFGNSVPTKPCGSGGGITDLGVDPAGNLYIGSEFGGATPTGSLQVVAASALAAGSCPTSVLFSGAVVTVALPLK